MRVGKLPTSTRDSGTPGSSRSTDDDSAKRRQSLTSTVTAFAAELRSRPKKPASIVLSRLAGGSKSTDDLSLANAARSKSCTHLPATRVASNEPVLTLVLSSTSFLDTTISESGERLYVIDTKGARTNISREDLVQGVAHVGAISWMDDKAENKPLMSKHAATIQMAHGRRYNVEDFLRRTKLTSSRLFKLPHYPHALKWKRSGGNFKLTVTKGKTLAAVLETSGTTPRIKVFETLYEHDVTRPLREHKGIPVLLLDYLIATALLITVEKDAWLASAGGMPAPGSSLNGVIQRWRMGVQADPAGFSEVEEELESGSSTPDISTSSVIDIGAGPLSTTSHAEVSSDPGMDNARRPQSLVEGTRHSQLMTTPQSVTLPPMILPPFSLTIGTHHPFASELGELEDGDEDGAAAVNSPLTSVLPPTLGVSLGDSSPSRSITPGSFSDISGRFVSPNIGSPSSLSPNRGYDVPRSTEARISPATPRQTSLPISPMATRMRRPATANAALGGSGGSIGRRPFRPLPKPPIHAAVLDGVSIPPVPPLPSPEISTFGRMPGSRTISLSSVPASHGSRYVSDGVSIVTSSSSNVTNEPRTIRRMASETTLLARDIEGSPQPEQQEYTYEIGHGNIGPPLVKADYRLSIYKEPLQASSPSPSSRPSTTSPTPTPDLTYSESSIPAATSVLNTAPLRIRHPRPAPAGASLGYDTDALLRAPSASSSSSHTHSTIHQPYRIHHVPRPSEYARPLPSLVDGSRAKAGEGTGQPAEPVQNDDAEEDDSDCVAPPAYDTIDFSHPPLKTTSFRGVG